MVTPKLWSKITTVQGINYIINPTITETKTNPKSGGKIYLLFPGSQSNATSGT